MDTRNTSTAIASRPATRDWVWLVGLLAAATLACWAIDHTLSLTSQAMIYVLAVVVASHRLDWVKSVACAVMAVTALNFFFVPPRFTLEVESNDHLLALGTMLAVALVISRLTSSLRRETELARLNEARAKQLQALASELADAQDAKQVQAVAQQAFDVSLAGPNWVLLGSVEPGSAMEIPDPIVRDGLVCCMRESAVLGPGTGRWPGIDAWYIPLGVGPGQVYGAACLKPAPASDEAGLNHAKAMGSLVGQALHRIDMNRSIQQARALASHQQLQNTFLASISHDLRTPLSTIVGTASALLTQHDKWTDAQRQQLVQGIASEAAYLSQVTENTLQLVRLGNGDASQIMDWESVEEVVGAALARISNSQRRRVVTQLPASLPLIRADAVLLTQLLVNLIENALKYSDGQVEVHAQTWAGKLQIGVQDHGPGIPLDEQQRIFDPYVRADRTGQRGAGLGLAVCKAIAQCHRGQLDLVSSAETGSCFSLTLPLPEQQANFADDEQ
jgi:two-component system, OmpR family, sensor histidine kinase KdpD